MRSAMYSQNGGESTPDSYSCKAQPVGPASEESLRHYEQRFRSLFENNLDAVFLIVADGTIVAANPAACAMFAMSETEICRAGWAGLIDTSDPDHETMHAERGLTGRLAKAELRYRRFSGEIFKAEVDSVILPENPPRAFVIMREVTERNRVRDELRQSEERYGLLLDKNPDGVFSMDPNGRFLMVNPACEKISGYSRAELLEKRFPELCAPDQLVKTVGQFQQRLQEPGHVELETALIRKDGTRVELWVAGEPLVAKGKVVEIHCTIKDITRRKQSEGALQQAAEQYQRQVRLFEGVVSTTPDFVYVVDLQGRFLYANTRLLKVWGMQLAQVVGKTCRELGYEQWHHDMHMREMDQVIKTKRPVKGEVPFKAPLTGFFGVYEYIFTPVISPEGEVELIAGTTRDITDRKKTEEALRDSETKLRLALEGGRIGMWSLERATRKADCTPLTLELWGFSPTAPVPRQEAFIDRIHPDDRQRIIMALNSSMSKAAPYWIEHRVLWPDGSVHWLESRGRHELDADGQPVRFLGITMDVTERKQAEIALQHSEEQQRQLSEQRQVALDAAMLGWWHYDPLTKTTDYDTRFAELHGIPIGPCPNHEIIKQLEPGDRNTVWAKMEAALNPASPKPYKAEYRVRAPGGPVRWIEAYGLASFEGQGESRRAVSFAGTVQDVTARKLFQAELERLVAERTAKLQDLVGELEHFSYTITHDMRAPLRAMRGYGELANDLCSECGHHGRKEFIRKIMTSAERMDALIRDALNYSQSVRQELPLEEVDLGALLRGMLDSYPEFQPSKAHVHLDDTLPVVLGNEAGMTQCFSNLLGNAVKFVKPGEIPQIRVWAEARDEWARIWVEDNGIGISKEMLPRVFDMFSRGSTKYQGTGIGLALVRKVTQRMGGKAGVESEEGTGSRFWLELKLPKGKF